MSKNLHLTIIVLFNLIFLPVYSTTSAEWSPVQRGDGNYDLWAIWGSSASDVYAVGTGGINLHYDGNPDGNWITLPDISP